MQCLANDKKCMSSTRNLDIPAHNRAWALIHKAIHNVAQQVYDDKSLCDCTFRIVEDVNGYHQFISWHIKDKAPETIPIEYDTAMLKLYNDMGYAVERCKSAGRCL